MTRTLLWCLLLAAWGLLYTGCSTTSSSSQANIDLAPPPPVVVETEPEVEPVEEPKAVQVGPVDPIDPELAEKVEVEVKEVPKEEEVEPENLTILGFIKYVELEGGFFGIVTEEGAKYFPEYLEQDYKVDGLSVRVVAKPQEQILGIQMWGTPIEIVKIEAN